MIQFFSQLFFSSERDKKRKAFKQKVNAQYREVSKRFPTARGAQGFTNGARYEKKTLEKKLDHSFYVEFYQESIRNVSETF